MITEKRLKIFSPYINRFLSSSNHFKSHFPYKVRVYGVETNDFRFYACPLCLVHYIVEVQGLVGSTIEFSLDHFPPDSVGGRHKALVCKNCNNNAGGKFESSLKDLMKYKSFAKGVTSVPIDVKAILETKELRLNSKLSLEADNAFKLDFGSSPNSKLEDWFSENKQGDTVTFMVSYKLPDKGNITKSLLKTAYLICFTNWGYDFALSETGRRLRESIFNNIPYPVPVPCFSLEESIHSAEEREAAVGICYLTFKNGTKCFLINFPIVNPHSRNAELVSVLIPSNGENEWLRFCSLKEELVNGSTIEMRLTSVERECYLKKELEGYTVSSRILATMDIPD